MKDDCLVVCDFAFDATGRTVSTSVTSAARIHSSDNRHVGRLHQCILHSPEQASATLNLSYLTSRPRRGVGLQHRARGRQTGGVHAGGGRSGERSHHRRRGGCCGGFERRLWERRSLPPGLARGLHGVRRAVLARERADGHDEGCRQPHGTLRRLPVVVVVPSPGGASHDPHRHHPQSAST